MNKIKKLTWFGAFCSLFQYFRDRKLGGYLLANAFSCVVPGVLLALLLGDHIHWAAFITITAVLRLVFAPVDDYTSEEYAFSKLGTYPLSIFEKVYVRLVAKVTQISEWLYSAAIVYVYQSAFPGVNGALLAVVTVLAIQISEEIVFYLVYLVKNVKVWVAVFELLCAGLIVLSLMWTGMAGLIAWVVLGSFAAVLVLSLAAMILLHRNRAGIHPLSATRRCGRKERIPLSSRLLMGAASGSALKRLVCLEWLTMLKLKVWDLISALGYLVLFAVLDKSGDMTYVLVQYLIVDYCFLAGFNHFGTINDQEGLFLFCTVDRKTQLRSKNLAMGAVLLVISTVTTLVLGIMQSLTLKALLLTLVANVFCIAVMLLCSSVVSITHFHLNESKKKYTVSNMILMFAVLLVSSLITAFLFGGGILAGISLIFMVSVSLACVYFTVVDMSMLEKLFTRHEQNMIRAMRGV